MRVIEFQKKAGASIFVFGAWNSFSYSFAQLLNCWTDLSQLWSLRLLEWRTCAQHALEIQDCGVFGLRACFFSVFLHFWHMRILSCISPLMSRFFCYGNFANSSLADES